MYTAKTENGNDRIKLRNPDGAQAQLKRLGAQLAQT